MKSPQGYNKAAFWGEVHNAFLPTPWIIYLKRKVKRNPRISNYANAILRYLLSFPKGLPETEEDTWFNTSDIKKALCPTEIPNETTLYRLLDKMAQYEVVRKKVIHPTPASTRTFYQITLSGIGLPIKPSEWDDPEWLFSSIEKEQMRQYYKLFVQAEAGRRVLIRNGLFSEWIQECVKIASAEEMKMDYSISPTKQEVAQFPPDTIEYAEEIIENDVDIISPIMKHLLK